MACTLDDIINDYARARPLSPGAVYLLRRTAILYTAHLGHLVTTDDLTDDAVSSWIAGQEGRTSQSTLAGHRTRLLCLWRFAAKRRWCLPPGDVRPARPPDPQPEAWTIDEVGRLLAACPRMGADGAYLAALISTAYESGLRRGDCQRLHRMQIGTVIRMRQHKTGFGHEPQLRPETVAAVLALPGEYPLRCPWSSRRYTKAWRRLRKLAALPDRGGCQQLRRTGATWVAVSEGIDAAREFLGHRSAEMVEHYVDRRFYKPRGHLPPAVETPPGLRIAAG